MNKTNKELCYDLWAMLDSARDIAYVLEDKESIELLSKLRKKYLKLSEVGDKVVAQLNKSLSVN